MSKSSIYEESEFERVGDKSESISEGYVATRGGETFVLKASMTGEAKWLCCMNN